MKRALISIAVGNAVTLGALFIALSGFKPAYYLLYPGVLVVRVLFQGVHAESHIVGWPSSAEIATLLLVNVGFYALVTHLGLRFRSRTG